jgi:adenylate kinase family enzyme
MIKPRGIIVFGANGSGKTTLGRELAHILNCKAMDIEDYYFKKSEIPYTAVRPYEDVLRLLLADIKQHRTFVLSSVIGNYGEAIPLYYKLAVHITAPHELRMGRIKKRAYDQYGKRVLKGGDMYEQEQKFFNFIDSRPLSEIDKWAETLTCPIIHIDGTEDWRINATYIVERFINECVLENTH